jgi:hypothetical protein
VFAEVEDYIYAELKRSGIIDLVGQESFFDTLDDVLSAYSDIAQH